MRFSGTLKSWNDDRGFGFIEPSQGGQEIFVHIKAFPAGTGRPSIGQQLDFEVETTASGQKRARAVQYPVRPRVVRAARVESPAPWTLPRLFAVPRFAAIYGYVSWRWGFRPPVLLAYLDLSLVAFLVYAVDKSAARAGRWRTPESTLHFVALAGGWPGALLAQQLLRHKTSKQSFVVAFWVTVALNVAAFVGWHAGILGGAKHVVGPLMFLERPAMHALTALSPDPNARFELCGRTESAAVGPPGFSPGQDTFLHSMAP